MKASTRVNHECVLEWDRCTKRVKDMEKEGVKNNNNNSSSINNNNNNHRERSGGADDG